MDQDTTVALSDALFVLTGPTSGLGLALYDLLSSHEVPVVAIGRDMDRVSGGSMHVKPAAVIEADFATPNPANWLEHVDAQVSSALDAHSSKKLIFINNAGVIAPLGEATDLRAEALALAMQVNFVSPIALAGALLRLSIKRKHQLKVVNITTGAALRPIAGWLAYCASKAACRMAFDVMAAENPDVEILHVDPGVVDTAMQEIIRQNGSVSPYSAPPADPALLKSPSAAARDVITRLTDAMA